MIKYVVGDATEPIVKDGVRIIAHINNDQGGWGSGFVVALSKKWSQPEMKYREWHRWVCERAAALPLGQIQMVKVPVKDEAPLYVANMVAQHKYASKDNPVAIRYGAFTECLIKVNKWAGHIVALKKEMIKTKTEPSVTFHMPRVGSGLARGDWSIISSIITPILNEGDVYVYDLPKDKERDDFDNLLQDIREGKI